MEETKGPNNWRHRAKKTGENERQVENLRHQDVNITWKMKFVFYF